MTIAIHIEGGVLGSYHFANPALLRQALTHKSVNRHAVDDECGNYERLEFLGDSVLGLIVSEYLWRSFPQRPEGELSRFRAQLVNEETLAAVSRNLQLNRFIAVGHGERESGGADKDSILADVFEALVGALYVDGGLEVARDFVAGHMSNTLHSIAQSKLVTDFKTELQEILQSEALGLPVYRLVAEFGPPHNRVFEVEVIIGGVSMGRGSGSSKKRAEQAAACRTLELMANSPELIKKPIDRQECHYA